MGGTCRGDGVLGGWAGIGWMGGGDGVLGGWVWVMGHWVEGWSLQR